MSKHMVRIFLLKLDTENIKKQVRKVFQHFDDDGAGYLDFRKVKTMVSECFFNLDDDAVTNMIKAADTEGDMKISEYEFFRIMKKVKLI
jgi:Ca2+-binding EF-hand superfamily protein